MKSYVQIYGNPDDLSIVIGERKDKTGVWCMMISRGPGDEKHAFYPIFSTEKKARFSRDQAIQQLREVLTTSKNVGEKVIFGNHDREKNFTEGLLQILFNSDKLSKEDYTKKIAPVLEDEDIEKIIKCVSSKKGNAETYTWGRYWKRRCPALNKVRSKVA